MKTQIELTDLSKSDKDFPPEQIGKLQTASPQEVGGRGTLVYYSRCSVCGFVGVISDSQQQAYQCSQCGTVLSAAGMA